MIDLDALSQELFSDGININDFMTLQKFYQECARCRFHFDEDRLPVLLKCGHVCC